VFATVVLGIIALGAIIIGYFGDRVTLPERGLLILSLLMLWWHEPISSVLGAILLLGIYLFQRNRRRKWQKAYAS
jgi:TRAP-type uncharacterized transport system fused permease subunit